MSSAISPAIHILAGEKVCIHVMTPTQDGATLASRQTASIASGLLTTGLATIRTGTDSAASNPAAICAECSATVCRTSSPYRP